MCRTIFLFAEMNLGLLLFLVNLEGEFEVKLNNFCKDVFVDLQRRGGQVSVSHQ